jgi:hypothetical protein
MRQSAATIPGPPSERALALPPRDRILLRPRQPRYRRWSGQRNSAAWFKPTIAATLTFLSRQASLGQRPDPPVEPNGPGLAATRSAGRVVTKMTLSESRGLSPDNLWTTLMDDFSTYGTSGTNKPIVSGVRIEWLRPVALADYGRFISRPVHPTM